MDANLIDSRAAFEYSRGFKWVLTIRIKAIIMESNTQTRDFVHPELGGEVTAIGGHYVFNREVRLPYNGREIMYLIGYAVVDTSCCGVGGCGYVRVPGFIQQWKYRKTSQDEPVSQVQPLLDPKVQDEVRKLIQQKEMVDQVIFD